MNRVSVSRVITLIIVLVLLPSVVAAKDFTAVWSSDVDCSDNVCHVQAALHEAASNGEDDTINLPSTRALPGGVFRPISTLTYDSAEEFGLTIIGEGANETVLSGGGSVQVLSIGSTAAGAAPIEINVSAVAINHGRLASGFGSGMEIRFAHAKVTVEGSSFGANVNNAGYGGGLFLVREGFGIGTAIVRSNTFSHNTAVRGAGLYVGAPTILVEENRFKRNTLTETGGGGGGAYVTSSTGNSVIRDNSFSYNGNDVGVERCRGAGLFVNASWMETTTIKLNRFIRNGLGDGGQGAGAWVQRVDGPVLIESNIFEENVIGGSDKEVGGGGLGVELFGSFAQGTIVNNVFMGNETYQVAAAAMVASLDTTVIFGNNTVVSNHPLWVYSPASTAVSIDARSADIYNNILRNTGR